MYVDVRPGEVHVLAETVCEAAGQVSRGEGQRCRGRYVECEARDSAIYDAVCRAVLLPVWRGGAGSPILYNTVLGN